MRTLEQEWAENALSVVPSKDPSRSFQARYRAYVDRLGPAVLVTGLGQALAVEKSAAGPEPTSEEEKAHALLLRNLESWLCRKALGIYPDSQDLLRSLIEGNQDLYLRAQVEALQWLEWHKKFCRAYLPKVR